MSYSQPIGAFFKWFYGVISFSNLLNLFFLLLFAFVIALFTRHSDFPGNLMNWFATVFFTMFSSTGKQVQLHLIKSSSLKYKKVVSSIDTPPIFQKNQVVCVGFWAYDPTYVHTPTHTVCAALSTRLPLNILGWLKSTGVVRITPDLPAHNPPPCRCALVAHSSQ